MKRLVAVIALVSLLAGCGESGPPPDYAGDSGAKYWIDWVDLGDGTEVQCVVWSGYRQGGMSCDWDHVRAKGRP